LTGLEASGRIEQKELGMRGHDDQYIQELLDKGVAYVNRQYVSFAPAGTKEEQIKYTCDMIAEYIMSSFYNQES
jgi:hypothetical protein